MIRASEPAAPLSRWREWGARYAPEFILMSSFDPVRLAKIVRRLVLPVMVVAAVWIWFCFGTMRAHGAMDTLTGRVLGGERRPAVPAGSLCIVDKRASSAVVGSAVFVELDDGSVLLSRVVAITEQGMWLENDNDRSRLPDSEQLHTVAMERHRGTVLVVFPPDGKRDGG